MAYKEVISKRRTVTFDLGVEKVTMTLKRFEGKVRKQDSLGRPAGWGMSGYTCVKCDHFPHADWRPYIDFGTKMADCSLDGWEAEKPEWPMIDQLAESMIFEYKGWTEDENYISVAESLKRIAKYNETLVKENAQKELKACAEILKEMEK
jgi:hypothetical protein